MEKLQFTIQMTAKILGVSQHTLRAWENRYQLVTPKRDHLGHRLYLEKDLQKLQSKVFSSWFVK